jgi:two-component system NtrC family sensor kinase
MPGYPLDSIPTASNKEPIVKKRRDTTAEAGRLREENAGLLDELELIYNQFLLLKRETDVSYAQLRAQNEKLERKVQELQSAYAKLDAAQDQLIHSERLAAMGQLAASIVHELNNPLTVVMGYLDILGMPRHQLNDECRQVLSIIRKNTDMMMHLVREILNFSRKQMTPFGPVRVNELIEQVMAFLGNIFKKKLQILTRSLDPDLPVTLGSAQQIQQVFANILTNAYDAMPSKGTVVIETACVDAAAMMAEAEETHTRSAMPADYAMQQSRTYERFIRIRFMDDGPGIAPEVIENIFNPFFTTKPAGQGTGLGLSICRTIIERHQGNLLVSSQVDRGTCFAVFLPVRSVHESHHDLQRHGASRTGP